MSLAAGVVIVGSWLLAAWARNRCFTFHEPEQHVSDKWFEDRIRFRRE